ncbi:hypothetical protein K450DRAFT_231888 [Umbelopsis ramanniana AG]|uniref:Uncharacterized protein n=1 Tax=Umbelopsis ramanniana AG TaxID=1314678 RepID=A0AAD5EEG4_UMBRA|nr:uncharacterized protein K450DRAFT_231888 [Umbelopsis ramanniana AG]KAI8581555.1 hypothetical protein K450DRAFT_231888 [Umbelopsis ramanniana AG]
MSISKTTWSSNVTNTINQKEISQGNTAFVDPAIDALFTSLKNEMDEQNRVIDNQRDELEALAFSPTSSVGLKLVQRCSALKAENKELGHVLHNGPLEKYKMEIAFQNKLINELQVALKESYAYAASLDREIEALQDELFECKANHTSG